jgi:hypothetical protein
MKVKPIAVDLSSIFREPVRVIEESDYIVVETRHPFGVTNKSNSKEGALLPATGWVELSPQDLRKGWVEILKLGEKQLSKILLFNRNLVHTGSYVVLVCGTTKDFWAQSRIEVDKFMSKERKELLLTEVAPHTRLEKFNDEVGGSEQIRADTVATAKLQSKLYAFSARTSEGEELPRLFMLDINVEEASTSSGELRVAEVDMKKFDLTLEAITTQIGKLLSYYSRALSLYRGEYNRISRKAFKVRERVQELQRKINDLLIGAEVKLELSKGKPISRRKPGVKGGRELTKVSTEEEELLRSASMYFSIVTEIEQTLSATIYMLHELNRNFDKLGAVLGLRKIEPTSAGEVEAFPSLFDELKAYLAGILFSFQNLRNDLSNSQTNLRNTVEVLRTSLESKQRTTSEITSRVLAILAIIFACFGIAEVIGEVLPYYLAKQTFIAGVLTFLAIIFSLAISLVVFLFLYHGYLKRYLGM